MNDMKYALIGCGRISQNHLSAAIENGLRVEALCDIYPQAMESLAANSGLERARMYTDYREMLDKEDLDLVAITTKSSHHAASTLDCIDKGVHIIVEKPMALSLADADAIIQESARKNVKVCSCHQNRFNKPIQKVRSALENGDFGRMMYASATIRWSKNRDYYKQAAWRGTWEEDGGALMNQCIHNIDLLRWMMGDGIVEVFAYTDQLVHNYIEAEDFGMAVIKFANGGYGAVEGTTTIYPANLEETLCLFGTEGTVKIGGEALNRIEHWNMKGSTENAESLQKQFSEQPSNIYGFGHTPLYKDMIRAICDNRKPYVDAVDGRNAIELVLAIYESSAQGRPVTLPLSNLASKDFIGRFGQPARKEA